MLNAIATLTTPTTRVMVSDGYWPEPTEVVSKLEAPTMCLLMSGLGHTSEGRREPTH